MLFENAQRASETNYGNTRPTVYPATFSHGAGNNRCLPLKYRVLSNSAYIRGQPLDNVTVRKYEACHPCWIPWKCKWNPFLQKKKIIIINENF